MDMARVECPPELVEMTQIKRSDDPATFTIEEANRPPPYQVILRKTTCHHCPFSQETLVTWDLVTVPAGARTAGGKLSS